MEDTDRVLRYVDNIANNNCEPPITMIQEVLYPEDQATPGKLKAARALQKNPVIIVNIPKGNM